MHRKNWIVSQDIYTGAERHKKWTQRRVNILCWQFLMHRKCVWIRKFLVKVLAQQGVTGDPGYAETQWSHGSTQHQYNTGGFFCTRGYPTDLSPSSYACGSCDWPPRCKCGCKQKYRSWSLGGPRTPGGVSRQVTVLLSSVSKASLTEVDNIGYLQTRT